MLNSLKEALLGKKHTDKYWTGMSNNGYSNLSGYQ